MNRLVLIALFVVGSIAMGAVEPQKKNAPLFPAGSILIQGEDAVSSNFIADVLKPPHTAKVDSQVVPLFFPEMNGAKASMLCTRKKPDQPYTAKYTVECRKTGRYVLWVYEQGRAWSSPFRWRLDSTAWNGASANRKMLHTANLGKNAPTFAWVRLGAIDTLDAGTHTLEIEVTAPRPDTLYLLSQDFFLLMPAPVGKRDPWPVDGGFERPGAKAVFLWQGVPCGSAVDDSFPPWMDSFMVKGTKPRGAVVVCPGGAYTGLAPHEGDTVARRFNELGYHAFVLHYRVKPHQYPSQLMDISRAVRLLRRDAVKLRIRPDRIAVCGFSAGGHLSATLGVHHARVPASDDPALDSIGCRPDALILCYAGLSMFGKYDNKRAWQMGIMPDTASDSTKKMLSVDLYVTKQTPPSFLWHCFDDGVDVRNSLVFATALRDNKVPCEMHIYPKGGHGLGLAGENPHVATWSGLCGEWLKAMDW